LIHGAKQLSELNVASMCLRRLPFERAAIVLRRDRSCWTMENTQVRDNMQLRGAKKTLIDTAAAGHTSHVSNPTMTVRGATRLLTVLMHFVLLDFNFGIPSVFEQVPKNFHVLCGTFWTEFVLRRTPGPLRSSKSPQRRQDGEQPKRHNGKLGSTVARFGSMLTDDRTIARVCRRVC